MFLVSEEPGGSVVKNLTANAGDAGDAGDPGSNPKLGRSPGGGNGNQLQYSCLENPMDRGAWWVYSPWGPKKLYTTERLSRRARAHTHTHTHTHTHEEPLQIN